MSAPITRKATTMNRMLPLLAAAAGSLLAAAAQAAAPGITGTGTAGTFNLTAQPAYISQPDGQAVYSWGYGCNGAPSGYLPAGLSTTPFCNSMQVPGPTLIVTENAPFTVNLTNNLPTAAGNTSILFPGLQLTSVTSGTPGLLTQEAAPGGGTVTYHLVATSPGTRAYYSGTQGDLQVEMGLYGAIIVLPSSSPAGCTAVGSVAAHYVAPGNSAESDFRLAPAAYDHPRTCYDR